MRRTFVFAATVLFVTLAARAATVDFTATLSGAAERPTPNVSTGTGTATGQLTGDNGSWVFTYHIEYSGLTSAPGLGHIHDAINPGGQPFTEQFGPIIHDLDSLTSPVDGDWRFDDAAQPLTDEHAASLQAGRLYFNFHTEQFPDGEIRGQIVPVETPPPPPQVIPLPPAVWSGLLALSGAGLAVCRRRLGA
jgi:hypothetical protein